MDFNYMKYNVFVGFRVVLLVFVVAGLLACSGEGQDQTVADFGVAYIKRPIETEMVDFVPVDSAGNPLLDGTGNPLPTVPVERPVETDVREAIEFHEGGDVYIRDRASAAADERNITLCLTDPDEDGVRDGIGKGDVRDLESSYDGTKLIFSLRQEDSANVDGEPKWNIYEYDATVGGCPTRVMFSDSLANKGNDVAPTYLPDGRIVFSSSLQRATGAILLDEGNQQFQPLDESLNEPAVVLHVMNADGTNVQQISFNQSHDLDPSVLSNGEIIFSRWEHMGGRNEINLYKMRPDGTELKALYGVHDHAVGTGGSTVQYMSPREQEDGQILVMIKPFTGSEGGGAPARINVTEYADNTQPTWPYVPSGLTGPAQAPVINQDVRTDGSPSPAGRFRSVYPLGDGSNRALVSWSQCRLQPTFPATGLPDLTKDPIPCSDTLTGRELEAFPIYGVYVYDLEQDTQLPVVVPEEGVIIDEPVVLAPRDRPDVLYDKTVGFELDATLAGEGVGLLHIRSVYDFDGSYNALGGAAASLADMANPTVTDADQRPARFLRIVKAASIPDDDVYDFDRAAFGRSTAQKMREIIGYASVEPDGSVLTKVPANVPLAISVVDKDGRRIGGRHQNWIQLRLGETLQCAGCHDHSATGLELPHGYSDGPISINTDGLAVMGEFPGTDTDPGAAILPANGVFGETMAKARIRTLCDPGAGINYAQIACPQLSPSVNPVFTDVWAGGAVPDVTNMRYDDTTAPALTNIPASAACQSQWSARCRTIINYTKHIHPLWNTVRLDGPDSDALADTCTGCHTENDGAVRIPDGVTQLDLTDRAGDSDVKPMTIFRSYEELLSPDDELEIVGGVLQIKPDEILLDIDGNPVLDANGVAIVTRDFTVGPSIRTSGAADSNTFFGVFAPGGSHEGRLTSAELRLISEWVDIGAQYYNSPFDAPLD